MQTRLSRVVCGIGCLAAVSAGSIALADDMPAVYDAAAAGEDVVAAPNRPVAVEVDWDAPLLTIPEHFYGVNIHPIPAHKAFAKPALAKALKPDVVRIMGNSRTHWERDASGKSMAIRWTISPAPGQFDWSELDALLTGIRDIGAEPYLAIGFGAPAWLAEDPDARLKRVAADRLPEYAEFMAAVVKHVNVDRRFGVKWVTVDNEPENLQYAYGDFIKLVNLADEAIGSVDPQVKINGPTTGYANWKQPDGSSLGFMKSIQQFARDRAPFDMVDWHIYSTNPEQVTKTARTVKQAWPGQPLVISELNRDWRYSGKGGERSKQRNSGWGSVSWLARCYDLLQREGVEQVHYFGLADGFFGLYDYHSEVTRPNYHLFYLMTNVMGRERVETKVDHDAIGVFATTGADGGRVVMLYNRADAPVAVTLNARFTGSVLSYRLDYDWYREHAAVVNGRPQLLEPTESSRAESWELPALGVLVLTDRP